MIATIALLYRRAFALIAQWPWLIALPVAAEAVQHVAEIQLGMYAGRMSDQGQAIRLAFGLVKVLAIIIALVLAWRLWRFEGDVARALRPTPAFLKGIALFLVVQIGGDTIGLLAGRGLRALLGDPTGPARLIALLPLLCWQLVSIALFPWYVGLAVEDRQMTAGRSIRAVAGRALASLGLLVAGILPFMALHYALGYAALGGAPAWPLMLVDALVVGLLAASMAATYFLLYERAAGVGHHTASARPQSRV